MTNKGDRILRAMADQKVLIKGPTVEGPYKTHNGYFSTWVIWAAAGFIIALVVTLKIVGG